MKYRAIAFRLWVKQMLHIVEVDNKLRFLTTAELISFLKSYLICRRESLASILLHITHMQHFKINH